jgi:hypothetical protein
VAASKRPGPRGKKRGAFWPLHNVNTGNPTAMRSCFFVPFSFFFAPRGRLAVHRLPGPSGGRIQGFLYLPEGGPDSGKLRGDGPS